MGRLPLHAACLYLASCLAACAQEEPPTSALLVTLDTTRADALGAYGGSPRVTPWLDLFASESLVFTQARTVAPLTLPAHCSMLTGLYPPRHGVRDNGARLGQAAETLAERARLAGYQTGAIVSAVVLDAETGAGQGFDTFEGPTAPELSTTHHYTERNATEITASARRWLAGRDRSRPFLLWVHYFDPHYPYDPPPEELSRTGDAYLGEVARMDAALGELLKTLDDEGLRDRTLLLVVADHGESLGEHGETSHSAFCYDAVLRVPLLVRFPDGRRAGERSDRLVSVVDVFPTIVDALGLGSPGDVDGHSLWPDGEPPARGVYFESMYGWLHYGWSPLVGWMDERGKYIHSSSPELFDPLTDPGEMHELANDRVLHGDHFLGQLRELYSRKALTADASAALDAERLATLGDIGYATGETVHRALPDPLEPSDRPAPQTRAEELGTFNDSQYAGATGRTDEAIVGFESILATNPLHTTALYELGQLYTRRGQYARAVELLARSIALGNDWYGSRFNLAAAYEGKGDTHEAIAEYERAFEQNTALTPAAEALVRLYRAVGENERADELQAQLEETD